MSGATCLTCGTLANSNAHYFGEGQGINVHQFVPAPGGEATGTAGPVCQHCGDPIAKVLMERGRWLHGKDQTYDHLAAPEEAAGPHGLDAAWRRYVYLVEQGRFGSALTNQRALIEAAIRADVEARLADTESSADAQFEIREEETARADAAEAQRDALAEALRVVLPYIDDRGHGPMMRRRAERALAALDAEASQ